MKRKRDPRLALEARISRRARHDLLETKLPIKAHGRCQIGARQGDLIEVHKAPVRLWPNDSAQHTQSSGALQRQSRSVKGTVYFDLNAAGMVRSTSVVVNIVQYQGFWHFQFAALGSKFLFSERAK